MSMSPCLQLMDTYLLLLFVILTSGEVEGRGLPDVFILGYSQTLLYLTWKIIVLLMCEKVFKQKGDVLRA